MSCYGYRMSRACWLMCTITAGLLCGCVIDDIPIEGKACGPEAPCPDGLSCIKSACTNAPPAFTVAEFRPLWTTPNTVRWSWQPQGDEADFGQYKVVMGISDDELEVARALALAGEEGPGVWTLKENPELGLYTFVNADNLVTATTTDALEPNAEYRAQLLTYDTAANVHTSATAVAVTSQFALNSVPIFDDANPNGTPRNGPKTPSPTFEDNAALAYEGSLYLYWPGFAIAPANSFDHIGLRTIATDANKFDVAFDGAFLEIALAIDGESVTPWARLRIGFGTPADACTGQGFYDVSPIAFRADGAYQLLQVPLAAFLEQDGTMPLTATDIETRSICEVSLARRWAVGESLRIDAISLRW